jgi:hypothetical protein
MTVYCVIPAGNVEIQGYMEGSLCYLGRECQDSEHMDVKKFIKTAIIL